MPRLWETVVPGPCPEGTRKLSVAHPQLLSELHPRRDDTGPAVVEHSLKFLEGVRPGPRIGVQQPERLNRAVPQSAFDPDVQSACEAVVRRLFYQFHSNR